MIVALLLFSIPVAPGGLVETCWDPVQDPRLSHYELYCAEPGGAWEFLHLTTDTCVIAPDPPGDLLFFTVISVGVGGEESPKSQVPP